MPKPKIVDLDSLLDESGNILPKGHDICSVGPSDSSDSGSDMVGVGGLDSTSDRNGTGERASVENDPDPGRPSRISRPTESWKPKKSDLAAGSIRRKKRSLD